MDQANIVAYAALLLFVPFAVFVYAMARPTVATAVVLVTAVLFLPEKVDFDPPGLPPFDKATISGLCALVGSTVVARGRLLRSRPGRGLDAFGWVLVIGAFATAAANHDVLEYGPTVLPALTPYDGLSDTIRSLLYLVFPFFLGRALYRDAADLKELMGVVVMAALVYSPLVVIELWMSPQLHRWIYGFHQHQFSQAIREGGYRPMVFMAHGIALAMFLTTAAMFAAALAKARSPLPLSIPPAPVAIWLCVLLLLCKSVGAAVYLIVCLPVLLLTSARSQARLAALLGLAVLLYPMLRALDLFPVKGLLDFAARFSQDRADSLAFRFDNETMLMKKALERAVFGWGGFARARVYAPWGQDISVTDGQWILALGDTGIAGFIGLFGMLTVPVLAAGRKLRRVAFSSDRALVSAMTLTVALNVVDLLPNGLYHALPLFYAGALAGVTRGLSNSNVEGGLG